MWVMVISRYGNTFGSSLSTQSKIASPTIQSLEEATVDCLIDAKTRQWNIDMVDGIFVPEEAEMIKNFLFLG